MRKIPELLAPAGSLEIAKGAVNAGADAVYFGGTLFSARAGAVNFTNDEIRELVEYCAPRGAQTYLALNIMIKPQEFDEMNRFVDAVVPLGVSGLIMQDIGAAAYVHARFPEVPISASTQMTIGTVNGARWAKEVGYSRVVLAREVPLDIARRIREEAGIETEIFVHGALCYSVSGQCLMSSMIGGRSGNRGRCAQSCRLSYGTDLDRDPRHVMNLKDMCGLADIKQIAESKADSLKIEGRLKSLQYVQGTVSLYRKALDYYALTGNTYEPTAEDMEELQLLFNRGGFSKGYLFGRTDNMIYEDSPKHSGIHAGTVMSAARGKAVLKLDTAVQPGDTIEIRNGREPYPSFIVYEKGLHKDRYSLDLNAGHKNREERRISAEAGQEVRLLIRKSLVDEITGSFAVRKRPVKMHVQIREGDRPVLTISLPAATVQVVGENIIASAETRPATEADIRKIFSRLGETPFALERPEDLTIELKGKCFVPVSAGNALRREACEELIRKSIPERRMTDTDTLFTQYPYFRNPMDPAPVSPLADKRIDAVVKTTEQAEAVLKDPAVSRIYLRQEYFTPELVRNLARIKHPDTEICLSLPYLTDDDHLTRIAAGLREYNAAGIRRVLVHSLGQAYTVKAAGLKADVDFGIPTGNAASHTLLRQQFDGVTLSPEMDSRELSRMPEDAESSLIVYGRIPVMMTVQDPVGHNGRGHFLIDRKGERWPVETDPVSCYNVLYLNRALWLADRPGWIARVRAGRLRLMFLDETGEECLAAVQGVRDAIAGTPAVWDRPSTKGRFEKGAE